MYFLIYCRYCDTFFQQIFHFTLWFHWNHHISMWHTCSLSVYLLLLLIPGINMIFFLSYTKMFSVFPDFKKMYGEDLPVAQCGFLSVTEMVETLSDTFCVQPSTEDGAEGIHIMVLKPHVQPGTLPPSYSFWVGWVATVYLSQSKLGCISQQITTLSRISGMISVLILYIMILLCTLRFSNTFIRNTYSLLMQVITQSVNDVVAAQHTKPCRYSLCKSFSMYLDN